MSKLISRKPLILRFREAVLMSLLLLSSISLNAAGGPRISVSGTVTSESDGEPLIGVSIYGDLCASDTGGDNFKIFLGYDNTGDNVIIAYDNFRFYVK